MKYPITVGVVCLVRHTFDSSAAAARYAEVREQLSKMAAIQFEFIESPVVEVEDAVAAARELAQRSIDGLVCLSGTFHLGHLALELRKRLDVPLCLWAWSELPYDGGKIRLNSLCGLNLNASNLYKAGYRDTHLCIGDDLDSDWLDALRIITCLRESRIGIAGYRAHGFFNLSVDEPAVYRRTGVLVDHYELDEIWSIDVDEEAIAKQKGKLGKTFDLSDVTTTQVDKVAALAAKFDALMERERLSALAVRCWPEMAARYGISPCAAMSLLQSEGKILACEGDLEGALSMVAQRAAGGETPFLFDFSQVNFEEDFALLWHCGVAPSNLWDGHSRRSLDTYFAGGKGVTADFVLKAGDVSILRFDSACGEQRVYLQRARGLPMEKQLKGTFLKVTFSRPLREVLEEILENGVAHHASMVYGDIIRPFQILAKLKGWTLVGETSAP